MATNAEKAVVAGAALAVTAAAVAVGTSTQSVVSGELSDAEIARFLTQCTFGVTDADIAAVRNAGSFAAWIDQQMAMTPFDTFTFMNQRVAKTSPYRVEAHGAFVESFWMNAITRSDQLRLRMQFALSQIFVISRENETLEFDGAYSTGAFWDVLGRGAFGNLRTLLNDVTLSPMMAVYLSYIRNDKEDPVSGRHPDENYAREIMQLFTLGTVLLNPDGTPVGGANTIPTYTHDDIAGLAKVFTGISWYSPSPDDRFSWNSSHWGYVDENGKPSRLIYYPNHHSKSEKKFLGYTIPASTVSDPAGDVRQALDVLFNHQNIAPYISKRLIKQFVTSNPSPAYVGRVSAVFANNGSGVRGDLGAVLKAILLDPEARDTAAAMADPNFGKLREPMIRVTNWARAFNAKTKYGYYEIGETGDSSDLSQGILDAPTVFNFWRANYVPPHSRMGDQGLTVPEFQVVNELTSASWLNLLKPWSARASAATPPMSP